MGTTRRVYHVTVAIPLSHLCHRFRFKLSSPTTTMIPTPRVPQIDLATLLSQNNPSIDLRVHAYEDSTRNFLKALTSYKNRAITTISERRKHQAAEKKRVLEKIQSVEKETNQCKLKEIDLVARMFEISIDKMSAT